MALPLEEPQVLDGVPEGVVMARPVREPTVVRACPSPSDLVFQDVAQILQRFERGLQHDRDLTLPGWRGLADQVGQAKPADGHCLGDRVDKRLRLRQ